jgi:DNA-binding MarR family transcriptional regulator
VAAALGIGESAASLLVEQLVRAKYAERRPDPSNRRRVIVTPTQVAEKLIGELRHGRRQVLVEWLASLDDTEIDALLRGLGALAQASAPKPRAQTSTSVTADRGMVSGS